MTLELNTIPGLFLHAVETWGSSVAMRRKHLGIWKEINWFSYRDHVQALYHGLKSYGVKEGDVVCILSENRPEWAYTDLACQCIGALPLGIYADSLESELELLINHNRSKVIVLENQEQTDKILNILDKLPTIDKCIVMDWDGMEEYDYPILISYEEVERIGSQLALESPEALQQSVAKIGPEDIALLSLTSGTTNNPRSVILTHQVILEIAESFMKTEQYCSADELISIVPLPWIVERCFSIIFHLKVGYRINFPECSELNVLFQNIREISPSIINCTASIWASLCATTYIKLENAIWFKRKVFDFFMSIAERVTQRLFKNQTLSWQMVLLNLMGDVVLFRKLRERLGLRLVRCAYTGGTAVGPEVYTFFHMIGIDLRQLYGLTEIGGVCLGQRSGEANPETIGTPLPGIKFKLSELDEILIYFPNFAGYYNEPAVGHEVYKDGWIATGDRGCLSDKEHIILVGRHNETIETVDGHEVHPELLENRLKFSPYIMEAIAVGQSKPFISALIQINRENVGIWAQKKGIPYTTFRDLALKPEVIRLIGEVVDKVNQKLDEPSRILQFRLLHEELDPDDKDLTRTRKLRRHHLTQKYESLINSMYQENRKEIE
jgi:long-chain acyl-CoA synthetase